MNEFSLEELAAAVQSWCEKYRVYPANGQSAEEISERTIRYYRTIGLLDAPQGNYTKTFTDKHRLQLIAIRVFQAQGLPLRKIRDELYGMSLEDLLQFEKQARARKKGAAAPLAFAPTMASENWAVVSLDNGFMLVSRENRVLPAAVIAKINDLLASTQAPATANERN
jgi:DNA-binding transcriptional MerR regulator